MSGTGTQPPPSDPPPSSGKGGRPRKYGNRIGTAIRFPVELHDRLEAAAAERDLPMNYLVNKAVEEFLDRLVPFDEIQWTRRDPLPPPPPPPPPPPVDP